MQNPASLYRLETDAESPLTRSEVMVVSLMGFLDAGRVQRLLTDHLLSTLEHSVVATFDVDQLIDYRGRRPVMTFDRDHWSDYSDPSLLLYRMFDTNGTPFLLLHGLEPDFQWERAVEAVQGLGDLLGVRLTASVTGVPMAVPHTRPVGFSVHATKDHLKGSTVPVFDTMRVPGSFGALLELRLGELGQDAVGYSVHVPHYLAQTPFPAGALTGLEALCAVTGLALPDRALRNAAAESLLAITDEVGRTDEAVKVVTALEEQYDAFKASRQRVALLAGDESQLPTAEELGQEFEAYLRRQADEEG